ncbi:MAG: hypothetical protein E8D46_11075 [Nitrospira sp.]|nr:MAG: hypothetical protein E8D46_11075 [Nitrospira sp.]
MHRLLNQFGRKMSGVFGLQCMRGRRIRCGRVVRANVETAAIETPELLDQGIGIRGPGQDNLFNGG